MTTATSRSVAIVTLGCARNEVDSEELAGRLASEGWTLVDNAEDADVAVVNTCGFVEQAKKDSIDALLEANDLKERGKTAAVVAVGCLAERYGKQLADQLPEADAVLGFDSYQDMSGHLTAILNGHPPRAHTPGDRRKLLPVSPVERQSSASGVAVPGHGDVRPPAGDVAIESPAATPRIIRARLDGRPWAPLKIASGCDRRCAFCAIPMFRGAFVSRRPNDVLAEARWLAEHDVKELFLVSENSTSYGKDLGDLRLLDTMLPELTRIDGIERVRVSYLQPAEVRPDLLDVMTQTPGVVPYFDISFQHASGPLLRRMRRFGNRESFLQLLEQVRERAPRAGIRSNVIVGFPGETDEDLAELEEFLTHARLDVTGVFGYSDEDGTEAETYGTKISADEIAARVDHFHTLIEELTNERAAERVGETLEVLVEQVDPDGDDPDDRVRGRAGQQGPDVDGETVLLLEDGAPAPSVGDIVQVEVVDTIGIDLVARPRG
ncbi:30S ribosomal protein S12 methylthiotransferase RimO [Leekyejoonella antrihumi]|uniref:Ribosomal protein uS12 methylthiotransferase RimO n=1 Tax=Leekyejoonella antrihumi TaxID=1660198 RepID=A0A563E532_9MICO|nr:30S ribosomal protein S12 methylthiotransferase RimO [Leekyejoonella antrihumi]TWP37616.1 30S ribosomal protein S12 methylthiotransferase RimO [Leekyejoonella antrihumi]